MHRRVLDKKNGLNVSSLVPPKYKITAGKGKKGRNCNVTACQQLGATWYNRVMKAWYCPRCAREINLWSVKDGHGEICALDPEAEVIYDAEPEEVIT